MIFCAIFATMGVGCSSGVEPGVADGADEPAPELTPEEVAGEEEAVNNLNQ